MSLLIQKSVAKLCRCQFRNRQPITASLPIQKSATKNFVAADFEISSQKLCCCLFRNQQQWWSHFGFTSLFFWVFTHSLSQLSSSYILCRILLTKINHVIWYNIYYRSFFAAHTSEQHIFSIIVYLYSHSMNFLLNIVNGAFFLSFWFHYVGPVHIS
jgi:hypothetical protein